MVDSCLCIQLRHLLRVLKRWSALGPMPMMLMTLMEKLSDISINKAGAAYRYEYPPQVSVQGETGAGASATAFS